MAALMDMHVHTKLGSLDSGIDPPELVPCARRAGLSALLVAEHYRVWTREELERWSAPDVWLLAGAEVATDVGHVVAVGFHTYPQSRTIAQLHLEAVAEGAALVLAHPFRAYFDSRHHWLAGASPAIPAAAERLGRHFCAIETYNNGCTDSETRMAIELQEHMQLGAVGGSDAHTAHQIGTSCTWFAQAPADAQELAAMLRDGPNRSYEAAVTAPKRAVDEWEPSPGRRAPTDRQTRRTPSAGRVTASPAYASTWRALGETPEETPDRASGLRSLARGALRMPKGLP